MIRKQTTPRCRFCGKRDGELVAVSLEYEWHHGVMQTVKSRKAYHQHAACLEAEKRFNEESLARADAERAAVMAAIQAQIDAVAK